MVELKRILGLLTPARGMGIAALLGCALVLGGCGQKGPLYLRPAATQAQLPPAPPDATARAPESAAPGVAGTR